MPQGEDLIAASRVRFQTARHGSLPVGALHQVTRHTPQGLTEITVQLDEGHASTVLVHALNGLHEHIVTSGLWGPRAGAELTTTQSMRYELAPPRLLPAGTPCIVLEREGALAIVVSDCEMSQPLADELNETLARLVGEGGDWIQHWGGAVAAMV